MSAIQLSKITNRISPPSEWTPVNSERSPDDHGVWDVRFDQALFDRYCGDRHKTPGDYAMQVSALSVVFYGEVYSNFGGNNKPYVGAYLLLNPRRRHYKEFDSIEEAKRAVDEGIASGKSPAADSGWGTYPSRKSSE